MTFTADGAAAADFGIFFPFSLFSAAKFRFFRVFGAGDKPTVNPR